MGSIDYTHSTKQRWAKVGTVKEDDSQVTAYSKLLTTVLYSRQYCKLSLALYYQVFIHWKHRTVSTDMTSFQFSIFVGHPSRTGAHTVVQRYRRWVREPSWDWRPKPCSNVVCSATRRHYGIIQGKATSEMRIFGYFCMTAPFSACCGAGGGGGGRGGGGGGGGSRQWRWRVGGGSRRWRKFLACVMREERVVGAKARFLSSLIPGW